MKLEHFLTPYTKMNSKWIKDLNVRPVTIKLLEENIGKTLSDINHSRIHYDPPPRILEIKRKINKRDLIKLRRNRCFFLEFSCFFDDPAEVGSLISGSSAFSKISLNIWKFMVHVLLKSVLENFEHYFTSV